MPQIQILPARAEDAPAVEAFNDRLRTAGASFRLSTQRPFADYALRAGGDVALDRYFVWVDGVLRGGVVLKRLPFWLVGEGLREVAFYSYPVSEGVVNPEFAFLGLAIQKFVTRQHPMVYGLGTGGLNQPVARLMVAGGWVPRPVPFRFQVFRAGAFLRETRYLRGRSWWARVFADLGAATGMGALGLLGMRGLQWLRGRSAQTGGFHAEPANGWGDWVDSIWLQAREQRDLIGDRSEATLVTIYPDEHRFLRRLRVVDAAGQIAGWAVVVVARQRNSRYFGNACLGTLVDFLALPGREARVVAAVFKYMEAAGADLAVVNHSDPDALSACERSGLWPAPTNFFLFLSPALARKLPAAGGGGRVYFTRGDGDGPIHLA